MMSLYILLSYNYDIIYLLEVILFARIGKIIFEKTREVGSI